MAAAIDRLGGLDGLVYATGMGPLVHLVDADQAVWRQALETNLLGASLVTRAAMAGEVVNVLASPARVDSITLQPPTS